MMARKLWLHESVSNQKNSNDKACVLRNVRKYALDMSLIRDLKTAFFLKYKSAQFQDVFQQKRRNIS